MKRAFFLVAVASLCAGWAVQAVAQTAISADGVVESTSGGIKFPDGTLQATSACGPGVRYLGITVPTAPNLGYVALSRVCQTTFGAGTRMCRSSEIMSTVEFPGPADYMAAAGWVAPVIISAFGTSGGPSAVFEFSGVADTSAPASLSFNCKSWTATNENGLVVSAISGSAEGQFSLKVCTSVTTGVACCG